MELLSLSPFFSLSVSQLALYNTSERLINFKACWETFKGRVTLTWQKECKSVIFMTPWQVNSESKDIQGLWFGSWKFPLFLLAFEDSAVLHIRGSWLGSQRELTARFGSTFPLGISFHKSFTSLTTYSCWLPATATQLQVPSSWWIQIQALSLSA